MENPLEKEWEKKLVKVTEKWDWLHLKIQPRGDKAWPDQLFITDRGEHVWFECKRVGEEPTPLQYYKMSKLRRQGAKVHWADNIEDAVNILSNYLIY